MTNLPSQTDETATFPKLTKMDLMAFQFSSWYPTFSGVSIRSSIIRPLTDEFCQYLTSEGVFIPEGSEDFPAHSSLSDNEEDYGGPEDKSEAPSFSFPELDSQIRAAISTYGAVFPKLNFSSPKDASWVLPASSPLKCTTPAEVYMLLKSSDFISHDITPDMVFDGCVSSNTDVPYKLELILRKWYHFDTSREFRCFVRENILIGRLKLLVFTQSKLTKAYLAISQRDPNYYDFMIDSSTQEKIVNAIVKFWTEHIVKRWFVENYIFDVLMTRDLSKAHIIDFNPYAPRTDSLLFSYEELHSLLKDTSSSLPVIRVIDSPMHISTSRNAPQHQHNMLPLEALNLSAGQNIDDFEQIWKEEIGKSMADN